MYDEKGNLKIKTNKKTKFSLKKIKHIEEIKNRPAIVLGSGNIEE